MSCESKDELNGEKGTTTEQKSKETERKFTIKDSVEFPTDGTSGNEDQASAHSDADRVLKTDPEKAGIEKIIPVKNGVTGSSTEYMGNETSLQSASSQKVTNISVSEEGKNNATTETHFDSGNETIITSEIDGYPDKIGCFQETHEEIDTKCISNELKRSIVDNVVNRYIQDAKKPRTEVESPNEVTRSDCSETSDYLLSSANTVDGDFQSSQVSEFGESQASIADTQKEVGKSVTRGIFAKLDNNATSGDPAANLAHKNVKEDENEAGVLLKESAGSMTVTEDLKSDICTKDSQNDLECPHLESEASVELDFPSIDMEINRTIAAESPVKKLDEKMNKSVDIGLKLETVSELRNGTKQELFSKSQYEADQQLGRSRPSTPVVESKKVVNCMQTCKDAFSSANQNNTEKVIVYHEDTIRIVEKNKEPTYDKENNVDTAQKDPQETKNKSSVETANTSSALCRNKAILESKKLSDPSPYKPKGQKLDELVSKIATKASNLNIPKKAKARKSFSQSSTGVEKAAISSMPVAASAITSLTFNVKMLEKQGVLDIPKTHNKRKAFEPFKLKVKQPEKVEKSSVKVSPVRSPMKSPKDSPFFNTSKVIKGRRRKKKKMGSYRLPSEKKIRERQTKSRERKKASEERQLSDDEKSDRQQDLDSDRDDIEKKKETDSFEIKSMNDVHDKTEAVLEQKLMQEISAKSVDSSGISPKQQNALDMLTKNAKLSFTLNPNLNLKKAKKTVRPAVNHNSQTRTLDSFLKGDTVAKLTSALQQNHGQTVVGSTGIQQTQEPQDQTNSSVRKRKADEENILLDKTPPGTITEGHEEKKRKTEIPMGKSPPPVINILTGSPPLAGGIRPIIPASVSPSSAVTFTHINTPNSKQQPKTLIQNGTLNGMPVFQIISNGNFGPPQLVAIGTQGQSLLPSSLPKTAILQSPPRLPGAPAGMPVILTPVPMQTVVSSAIVSQAQNQVSLLSLGSGGSTVNIPSKALLSPVNSLNQATTMTPTVQQIAVPTPLSVFNQSILPSPSQANGQMPVLNHILKSPLEMPTLKPSHIPNGLYPVTPPRTPDEQAGSDTGSQESVGTILVRDITKVSPGQQISPEKDIISLCTCKLSGATFPKLAATVTFCQALDSVDRKAMGCCNKVSNSQLVRPAVKIPFMAVCENHRKRLRLHQCCPGCGHFCTQGKFLQCRNEGNQIVHNFHEQCQVIKDGKNYCPHCGETSLQVEVTLMLQEKKPPTIESKSSRIQTKAKMAVADKRGSGDESGEETVVVIEKTKKVLSTSGISVGPDKHSIERVLSSLSQERPKKYRHLPKCLYTPAYDNDLERVVYMLEDGHDPNEKYDDLDGQGAIHAAATVGSLPIVHMLIQAGASPHLQDKTLRTPLMYAAENNNLQVVKYLIKVGAVIDSKSDDGMTSLHYAAKAGHVGVIRILLDIEGINIDVKDDGGYTPLIWASEHEQLDVVKFLLKRNADPNLRDSEENTALHWAAFSGSSNVAEVLLNAGCELDSLNMHGDRPLHIASRQDHYECVVLFLARGADVELENNKGENPMKCCLDQNSPTALALNVNKKLKGFGAKHMGRPEKLLHRDISKGRENIPIPCVNGIDDEGIPTDYLYVTDNIETKCLNINRVIGSLQCCQCKDECSSIYCACGKNSVKCWYDKYGRLLPEFNMLEPSLIFECNRACECWTTCNNRVVQNGVMSRLQVFKTEGRGWGCKTLVNIARGTFICEYIGEHISDSEADRREDDSYLFDLDNKDGETYCIDARKYGNVARFINHLCEPNLVPVKVFVDSQDLRFPRICLFASRDINAQEELGFDYGEKFWIIKWKHFTCTCGSLKCRYSKDTIQKTLEEYRVRHEEDIDITKD